MFLVVSLLLNVDLVACWCILHLLSNLIQSKIRRQIVWQFSFDIWCQFEYVEKLYPWVGLSKIRFRCFITFVVQLSTQHLMLNLNCYCGNFFSHKWNETLDFYLYFFCFYAFSSPSSNTKACFFGLLSSQTHSVEKTKFGVTFWNFFEIERVAKEYKQWKCYSKELFYNLEAIWVRQNNLL